MNKNNIRMLEDEQLKEFYKLPTMEEIINNLGNEFTLQELKEHFPNFKKISLSVLMDRLKYKHPIHKSYEIIDNVFTLKYKIAL